MLSTVGTIHHCRVLPPVGEGIPTPLLHLVAIRVTFGVAACLIIAIIHLPEPSYPRWDDFECICVRVDARLDLKKRLCVLKDVSVVLPRGHLWRNTETERQFAM